MSTFLRVIGILSLISSFFLGLSTLPLFPTGAVAAVGSGIVTCIVFWWMAAMLDASRATAGNLEIVYEALQAMTKQQAAAEMAVEGAATMTAGTRVRHPMLGDGKIVSTDGIRASVLFDGRDAEESVNAVHLRRAAP